MSTPPARPRSRDMFISLLVLLPVVAAFALAGRSCSVSPGGPGVDPHSVPIVDVGPALTAAARQVPFPLRAPITPAGWRSTVVDRRPAPGGASAVRVSWLTAGGRYLRLVQTASDGTDEGALLVAETGGPPTGAAPADGSPGWVGYRAADGEQAWTHREGPTTWLITGDGDAAEFRALAAATAAAPPLPGRR